MTQIAYFDCFSGASGDMILGSLLDAGLSFDQLSQEIERLALPDGTFSLAADRVQRAGLAATKLQVNVNEAPRHRSLDEVLQIVKASLLPAEDRERISNIFLALGEAEAKVHGTTIDEVELHEVGSVDALVDVTGAVAGLRLLGVSEVYVSPLPLGHGQVKARHGILPVPAPATLNLIAAAAAPIDEGEGPRGELVTPTGAAILTTIGRFQRPAMNLKAVGCGAGGRDPEDRPNVLRVWLGEAETSLRRMRVLETNIDDMSPEMLGYVQERLFAAGAADVWFTAIQMKKNRPAVMLSIIATQALEAVLVDILLRETSTLGVRVREVGRYEAERESLTFQSTLGSVAVKLKRLPGEAPRIAPEYDDCRRIAQEHSLPLPEVYRLVTAEAQEHLANHA